MEQAFTIASLWLLLALLSAFLASSLRLSIALVEICVGVATAAVLGRLWDNGAPRCQLRVAPVFGGYWCSASNLSRRG
jgi:hypothetical protein